jgi:DNA-binding winged helix-turn-helix (wHTH) protein/tetratricopeptide (TPR) repeat protein/TolB-like protein
MEVRMYEAAYKLRTIRFGAFTADLRTSELRKDGRPVPLQPQPFQVLVELLSRPGEIVTKDELMQSVWQGAFVTDEALTYAIWEVRKALGDDAKNPAFIQTVPRRGYRFIASVESDAEVRVERSRWRKISVAAAMTLIVFGTVWALRQFRPRPEISVSLNRMAVLPFTIRGGDDIRYLDEGMVDLLSATLSTESLATIDPETLVRFVHHQGGGELDQERGAAIAEHFGAGRYLLGSIVATGKRLRIHATTYETSTGRVIARASVEGEHDDLFSLVDDLATQILVGEFSGARGHNPRVAAMTTESLEALKAFIEGEKVTWRLEGRDHDKAYRCFQQAVEIDPTFALAWYRLSELAGSGWGIDPAEEYLGRALQYADRLPERDRLKIRANAAGPWYTSWEQSAEEAERRYLDILEKYPDDKDSWEYLAEIHIHYDWKRGRAWRESLERAAEYEERVQALDPSDSSPAFFLAHLYLYQGRLDDAERQWQKLYPDGPLPNIVRAQLTLGREDWSEWESLLADLRHERGVFLPQHRLPTYLFFADLPGYPERVREFIQARDLADTRSVAQRASGHVALAMWATGRGRWREAKSELEKAELLYPAAAYEFGAILSVAPFLSVPEDDFVSIRDKLTSWDPETETPKDDFLYPPGLHRVLRPYLLGLLSARLGDETAALEWASELEQISPPELMPAMPQDYARSIRAHVALGEGKAEDALALLEELQLDAHNSRFYFYAPGWLITLAHERFLRAELLHRLGRDEEAFGWYWASYPWGGQQFAFAHLRLAEILEKQGDLRKATEHYDLFVRFWSDCDPELRSIVEAAKSRLAVLQNEKT